jgi:Glycosyl transferase family 2
MKPTISICIPVFNQRDQLAWALEKFAAQSWILESISQGNVEILISNNCSTDSTESLSPIARKLGFLWTDQETNVGFKQNIFSLAQKASGKYVWFLGAGECLTTEQSFNVLLATLVSGDYRNGTVGTSYFEERSANQIYPQTRAVLLKHYFSFLRSPYTESIAGNIFRRTFFVQTLPKTGITGNVWPHIEVALFNNSIFSAGKVLQFQPPVVQIYGSEDGWWNLDGADRVLYEHIKVLLRSPASLIWPAVFLKFVNLSLVQNFKQLKADKARNKVWSDTSAEKYFQDYATLRAFSFILFLLIPGQNATNSR